MKKVFTLFAAIALTASSFAQQVPNGGFETWTNATNPDSWNTLSNIFGPGVNYFAVKDTSAGNFVQGTASLRLRTDSVPGQGILRSYVGLGTATAPTGVPVFTGVAYTKRPDSLYFDYKYTPTNILDSGLITFGLSNAGTQLFGGRLTAKLESTNSQWVGVAIPLTSIYTVSGNPDSLYMLFRSSKSGAAAASSYGTTLWIDAVHFSANVNVTGIEQVNGKIMGVNVYPNPASSQLNVAVETDEIGSQIQLFDMTGREVYNTTIDRSTMSIDTRNFEKGIYTIRVNSIDKITTYNGKISIAH